MTHNNLAFLNIYICVRAYKLLQRNYGVYLIFSSRLPIYWHDIKNLILLNYFKSFKIFPYFYILDVLKYCASSKFSSSKYILNSNIKSFLKPAAESIFLFTYNLRPFFLSKLITMYYVLLKLNTVRMVSFLLTSFRIVSFLRFGSVRMLVSGGGLLLPSIPPLNLHFPCLLHCPVPEITRRNMVCNNNVIISSSMLPCRCRTLSLAFNGRISQEWRKIHICQLSFTHLD